MRINADSNNDKNETKSSFTRLHNLLCYISIYKVVLTTVIVGFVLLLLYICKTYIRTILLWLEKQDSVIIAATILVLFILVSFPVSIGYIVLVTASGYLFNIKNGLLLSVIGANVGLLIAHNVIKLLGHHNRIRKFMDMEIAKAITRVIAGPLSFKIVLCARITPIPFGFQNTIFAVSRGNHFTDNTILLTLHLFISVEQRLLENVSYCFVYWFITSTSDCNHCRFHFTFDAGRF